MQRLQQGPPGCDQFEAQALRELRREAGKLWSANFLQPQHSARAFSSTLLRKVVRCGCRDIDAGVPGDGPKKRWCAGCAKPGSVSTSPRGLKTLGIPRREPELKTLGLSHSVARHGPLAHKLPAQVITQGATDKTKDAQRSTKRRRQSAGELEAEFEDENAASLVSLGGSETTM